MDFLKIKGIIEADVWENNKIIKHYRFENLVTDVGFNYIRRYLGGDNTTPINRIVLGDNNTPANSSDQALYNRLISVNVTKDYTIDKTIKFLAIVPANSFSSTVNYREAGLVARVGTVENLITRAVFNTAIFQRPENAITLSYSLKLGAI